MNQEADRGSLGAEEGLNAGATFPPDRCHLDDAAVRINRDYGDDTTVRKEDMFKRTVSVHENLLALAANVFKLGHEPLEIAGWQSQ